MGLSKNKKESIWWVFRNTCFLCSEEGEDIHHLDFNNKNNEDENLVLLCKKHHLGISRLNVKFKIEDFKLIPLK